MPRTEFCEIRPAIICLLAFLLSAGAAGRSSAGDCPPENGYSDDIPGLLFDFCLYYNTNVQNTSSYLEGFVSPADAVVARDHVDAYWDRYVNDFGFLPPALADDDDTYGVALRYTDDTCSGTAGIGGADIETACYLVPESLQKVIGHELFHSIQRSYDSNFQYLNWLGEGTARALEDSLFLNIDNWPEALSGDVVSSFNKEVNNYLACTNRDITSYYYGYAAALWWKYFSEQFGTTPGEPQLGIDAFVELFAAVALADDVAAVNLALNALGAGTSFHTAFRRFTAANVAKDLTGLPDSSYFYVDELQPGNPAPYGPLAIFDGGTVAMNQSVSMLETLLDLGSVCFEFNVESAEDLRVDSYGALYFRAQPGMNCDVLRVTFENQDGGPAFYHVVTRDGDQFDRHVEGAGASWVQSFVSGGITDAVAIAGSLENSSLVDVTFSCAEADLEIKLPTSGAVAHVGPFDDPGNLLVQVQVTDGSEDGPIVGGFSKDDFDVKVGGIDADIVGGGFVSEQYWLVVAAPSQEANGVYNLQASLKNPGSDMPLAIDVSQNSVVYSDDATDHVLVIDRSGSMGTNDKLAAAQAAAKLYVDAMRDGDGIAVVPYNHDVAPPPDSMETVDPIARLQAKLFVNALTAAGATSIGDGLAEAVAQVAGSPTGNPLCSIVLLSDGMENSPLFWEDVEDDVVDSDCPVTAIAFGVEADETLMQEIAAATGGASYFNDVLISGEDFVELGLADSFVYAQSQGDGHRRLLAAAATVAPGQRVHEVLVDRTVEEALFVLDWVDPAGELVLRLEKPDGTTVDAATLPYTFIDRESAHLGWRLRAPEPGLWKMIVTQPTPSQFPVAYQVLASGKSPLAVWLLLPEKLGLRPAVGEIVPIAAIVAGKSAVTGARVEATVVAPDGTRTRLSLHDDGFHGDGGAGDGLFANGFTRVTQAPSAASPREEQGEPVMPQEQGAYRVVVRVDGGTFRREALGAFAVTGGADTNGNGLPDAFEATYGVSDPDGDPDLDRLRTIDEVALGTSPTASDSDRGGENDGSEAAQGQDPLDAADDEIAAPEFFRATPSRGAVELDYDVKKAYQQMALYRGRDRSGPWTLVDAALSPTGTFRDPQPDGTQVFYRLIAIDGERHGSRVLASEGVTPRADADAPLAAVSIDGGAPHTCTTQVELSFLPKEYPELAADIDEVLIANDPLFRDAALRPFSPTIDWDLGAREDGSLASVYVIFRDRAGNLSGVETAVIRFRPRVCSGATIRRGDVDQDSSLDVRDVMTLLGFLFPRDPVRLGCLKNADVNDDGALDIGDPVLLMHALFLRAEPPSPFFPDCGEDPTPDALPCERPAACPAADQ